MEVQEGEGWRLVIDPSRPSFPVLLGGRDWAVELEIGEALALRQGLMRLRAQHAALVDSLMAEEAISLELEQEFDSSPGGWLWVGLEGDRSHWCLRFVLTPAPGMRAVEGGWDALASAALVPVLDRLDGLLSGSA
ncbi:MAG: DUF1818 family protein [Cyanobacteriota bacterium]|jgi:hypothetical protein